MAKVSFETLWNRKKSEKSHAGMFGLAWYVGGTAGSMDLIASNSKAFWKTNRSLAAVSAMSMMYQAIVNKQLMDETKMEYDNQE